MNFNQHSIRCLTHPPWHMANSLLACIRYIEPPFLMAKAHSLTRHWINSQERLLTTKLLGAIHGAVVLLVLNCSNWQLTPNPVFWGFFNPLRIITWSVIQYRSSQQFVLMSEDWCRWQMCLLLICQRRSGYLMPPPRSSTKCFVLPKWLTYYSVCMAPSSTSLSIL